MPASNDPIGTEELNALRLLEALQSSGQTTQRELSERAGISLGLTNLLLGRMARKAWVKLTSVPGRRMIYALTPAGLAEKARRTRDWVRHSYRYIRETREFVASELKKKAPPRPRVLCWGESDLAELVADAVRGVDGKLIRLRNGEAHAERKVDLLVLVEPPPRAVLSELKQRASAVVDLT